MPKAQPKPETRGRKTEGRVRLVVYVLPEVLEVISAETLDSPDTPGKALERLLGVGKAKSEN